MPVHALSVPSMDCRKSLYCAGLAKALLVYLFSSKIDGLVGLMLDSTGCYSLIIIYAYSEVCACV